MKPTELKRRVHLHNAFWIGMGIVLIPTSLGLWIVSFWVVRIGYAIPLDALGLSASTISFYLAAATMVVLAVEGARYAKPLFDLREYSRSVYCNNLFAESESGRALNSHYNYPLGVAFLVSQALFCAPLSTIQAIKAFRSLVPRDDHTIAGAGRILQELQQGRGWVPAADYASSGAALALLDRLNLLRVRSEDGRVRIRFKEPRW